MTKVVVQYVKFLRDQEIQWFTHTFSPDRLWTFQFISKEYMDIHPKSDGGMRGVSHSALIYSTSLMVSDTDKTPGAMLTPISQAPRSPAPPMIQTDATKDHGRQERAQEGQNRLVSLVNSGQEKGGDVQEWIERQHDMGEEVATLGRQELEGNGKGS